MDRTPAVNALRQTKVFRNASFRLLSDLIEKAEDEGRTERAVERSRAALVLVLDGDVTVSEGSVPQRRIRAHADWPGEPDFRDRKREVVSGKRRRYLQLTQRFLTDSHKASFSLFSSLDLEGWQSYRRLAEQKKRPIPVHGIWICEPPGFGAPIEAMAHLLAASVARDFDEPTAILSARGSRVELAAWEKGEFVPVDIGKLRKIDLDSLGTVLKSPKRPLCHVFLIGLSPRDRIPPALAALRFHRILYVTDRVPTKVPANLEMRLVPEARNEKNPSAPYFSSFVASVLRNGDNHRQKKRFSEPIVDEVQDADTLKRAAARRLNRDLCRIPFHRLDLQARWSARVKGGSTATFANDLLNESTDYRTIASRWARAITNRSVGLAVSGGGATSYRMVALLEMLAKRRVPVDVIGGISGGALVGAYYCRKGEAGLEQCVKNGPLFQRLILAAILDGRWFRRQIDRDLGHASMDDVDVRFVPVATALRDGKPPEGRVICGGTLGEAVHASGAAPGVFSPMDRKEDPPDDEIIRYTDGVSSRLIPARAVAEYGADLVIAYNTIPTPQSRNPFGRSKLGELAYEKTFASRVIDLAVSWLFFLAQCSSEVAEDAHHFIEPELGEEPLEAIRFDRAEAIVEAARENPRLLAEAKACAKRWEEFCAAPAFPAYWRNEKRKT